MPASATQNVPAGHRWIHSSITFEGYRGARGWMPLTRFARKMRDYTLKEKAKITAGAVAALVIVAWLAIIALALLSGG